MKLFCLSNPGETPAISPPLYFQFRLTKTKAFYVRIDLWLKPKYRNANHFPVRSGATYISLFLWFESEVAYKTDLAYALLFMFCSV